MSQRSRSSDQDKMKGSERPGASNLPPAQKSNKHDRDARPLLEAFSPTSRRLRDLYSSSPTPSNTPTCSLSSSHQQSPRRSSKQCRKASSFRSNESSKTRSKMSEKINDDDESESSDDTMSSFSRIDSPNTPSKLEPIVDDFKQYSALKYSSSGGGAKGEVTTTSSFSISASEETKDDSDEWEKHKIEKKRSTGNKTPTSVTRSFRTKSTSPFSPMIKRNIFPYGSTSPKPVAQQQQQQQQLQSTPKSHKNADQIIDKHGERENKSTNVILDSIFQSEEDFGFFLDVLEKKTTIVSEDIASKFLELARKSLDLPLNSFLEDKDLTPENYRRLYTIHDKQEEIRNFLNSAEKLKADENREEKLNNSSSCLSTSFENRESGDTTTQLKPFETTGQFVESIEDKEEVIENREEEEEIPHQLESDQKKEIDKTLISPNLNCSVSIQEQEELKPLEVPHIDIEQKQEIEKSSTSTSSYSNQEQVESHLNKPLLEVPDKIESDREHKLDDVEVKEKIPFNIASKNDKIRYNFLPYEHTPTRFERDSLENVQTVKKLNMNDSESDQKRSTFKALKSMSKSINNICQSEPQTSENSILDMDKMSMTKSETTETNDSEMIERKPDETSEIMARIDSVKSQHSERKLYLQYLQQKLFKNTQKLVDDTSECTNVSKEPPVNQQSVADQELISKLQTELDACKEREKSYVDHIAQVEGENEKFQLIAVEFEQIFHQLVKDKETSEAKYRREIFELTNERDHLQQDVVGVERSFDDLHRRFEKLKIKVLEFKKNEENLQKAIECYKQHLNMEKLKYSTLKKHAEEKLETANTEIEKLRKSTGIELQTLKAELKRSEIRINSLELNIQQKDQENSQLTSLLEDLLNKVKPNNGIF